MGDYTILLFNLSLDLSSRLSDFPTAGFFLFLFGDLLVKLDPRLPLHIEPLYVLELVSFACLVLLRFYLGLLGLLVLAHKYRLLDLCFLDSPVLAHLGNSLSALLGDDLFVLHLLHLFMDAYVVAFLQSHDFASAFLCLLDLFPGLHLFLLEQGDTVGKELRISLNVLTFFLGNEMRLSSSNSRWLRLAMPV